MDERLGTSPLESFAKTGEAIVCELPAWRCFASALAAVALAAIGGVPVAQGAPATSAPDARADRFVDSVLATLSLAEKIDQLTMAPAEGMQTGPAMPKGGEAQVPGAVGDNVRWGIAPDKLYETYQRFADEGDTLDLRALTVGQQYYVAIESFDENGVSRLSEVIGPR